MVSLVGLHFFYWRVTNPQSWIRGGTDALFSPFLSQRAKDERTHDRSIDRSTEHRAALLLFVER